jgi:hypothetical protein
MQDSGAAGVKILMPPAGNWPIKTATNPIILPSTKIFLDLVKLHRRNKVCLSSKKINFMKKILVTILAFATLAIVQAQEKKLPGEGKRPGLQRHLQQKHLQAEKLKLSDDQKQKAKTLNEDFRKKMMDLRKKDDITVKEWKKQMDDLRKKHHEEMQSLLTKEQKDRIVKMKEERKKMAEIDANARMEKMKLRLQLSNEQAEKMKKQRSELQQKIKALHENKSLNMQQKREEMKKLMENQKQEMKSILNEEQLKKMQELKKHGPRKPGNLS